MEKIRKYCVPNGFFPKILLIILLVGGIFLIRFAVKFYLTNKDIMVLIMGLLGGILMNPGGFALYNHLYRNKHKSFDQHWEYLKSKGLTQSIEYDFNNGLHIFGGYLIAGSHCMMGKNTGLIVLYNEMSSIRRHCHTTNYKSGRVVRIGTVEVTVGGKEYVICNMEHFQEHSQDWNDLCTLISYNGTNTYIDHNIKYTREYIDDTSSSSDDDD